MAVFRRRSMKKATTRIMTRKVTAPPIIPPISAVVSPLLLELPVAAVLAIAVGVEVTFGIKLDSTATVSVGADGVAAVTAVVVIVTACELASVVMRISIVIHVVALVVQQPLTAQPCPFSQHP
jgi:hypothetical protein